MFYGVCALKISHLLNNYVMESTAPSQRQTEFKDDANYQSALIIVEEYLKIQSLSNDDGDTEPTPSKKCSYILQNLSFHVVVGQRMAKSCAKIYNAPAQLLF